MIVPPYQQLNLTLACHPTPHHNTFKHKHHQNKTSTTSTLTPIYLWTPLQWTHPISKPHHSSSNINNPSNSHIPSFSHAVTRLNNYSNCSSHSRRSYPMHHRNICISRFPNKYLNKCLNRYLNRFPNRSNLRSTNRCLYKQQYCSSSRQAWDIILR